MENWSGVFTVIGTVLGYAISYFTSQSEKEWKKAKADISILTEQLQSYLKLEEIYSNKLAEISPDPISPITIKKKMRDEVESLPNYSRPVLTPSRLKKIRLAWHDY